MILAAAMMLAVVLFPATALASPGTSISQGRAAQTVNSQIQPGAIGMGITPTKLIFRFDKDGRQTGTVSVKNVGSNTAQFTVWFQYANIVQLGDNAIQIQPVSFNLANGLTISFDKNAFQLKSGAVTTIAVTVAAAHPQAGEHYLAVIIASKQLVNSGTLTRMAEDVVPVIVTCPGSQVIAGSVSSLSPVGGEFHELLPVNIDVVFKNTSNVTVPVQGKIDVYDGSNNKVATMPLPPKDGILPGCTAHWQTVWNQQDNSLLPMGQYRVVATAQYGLSFEKTASRSATVRLLPLRLIKLAAGVLVAIVLVNILFVLLLRRKKRGDRFIPYGSFGFRF